MSNAIDMTVFKQHCQNLEFRQRVALSVKLQKKTDTSHSGVWNWMNGTRTPKKPTREAIAKITGVKAKELFPGH